MTDARAAVCGRLDDLADDVVADISRFVQIPSVSGTDAEHDAQADMARRLAAGGMEVDRWDIDLDELTTDPGFPGMEVPRTSAHGVVGRWPGLGGGPCLMFNGHVDVVPAGDPATWSRGPFSGAVERGRVHGRGAADMKAGLLAAYWAIQAIRTAGVRLGGDVIVAPVQGEEDGGLGTFALLRRGWTADACVIAEPTSLDVIPANSGALTFRLRVRGLATHAARRTEGISAIEKFWPVWRALVDLEHQRHEVVDPLFARHRLAHPLSIGSVRSGQWASSVPDLLVAEGRVGVAIGESVDTARAELEAAVAAACADDDWLREHPVEVEWWGGQFAAGRLPDDSDLVDRVRAAHACAFRPGETAAGAGIPAVPDVYGAPYGSDLRLLTGLGGVPTVQYGPGDAKVAHGSDEWVSIEEVLACSRTLALLALDVCGVAAS